ncbi:MAG TPA: hypothetical protein VJK90_12150 [Acetobacteraceae bacterium]|jgi:hypothetical protein|nr:hypothetical protein [Acetobacteraceae bacterium]
MNAATLARWVVAVPLAAATYVLGFAAMEWVGLHIGGNPISRYTWAVAVATFTGALVGVLIVPSPSRRVAGHFFVGLPVALSVTLMLAGLVGHTFKPTLAFGVVGTLQGGFVVLRAFRRQQMAA